MNMRKALTQSPIKQALRDEGNGLRITVTRQKSEYYEVIAAMQGTVYFSEVVVDEQAVEHLLWERLRMQSILFEPVQTLPALVPVQTSPSPATIEQFAAEHKFGTLLKSCEERCLGMGSAWVSFVIGIAIFIFAGRVLLDDTVTIGAKMLVVFLGLPFSLFVLFGCYLCILDSVQINEILREIKDELLKNYQIILLYERGLICSKWIKRKGTWENDMIILPWSAIGHLQSSASPLSQGVVNTFTIKTKNGHSIDVNLGGQVLMNAIEKQMNASFVSAS